MLHERGRLAIVSVLAAAERLTFTELRDALEMTDGNLSVHLQKLEEKGYVAIDKQFVGRRPQTGCRLTRVGRQAFSQLSRPPGGDRAPGARTGAGLSAGTRAANRKDSGGRRAALRSRPFRASYGKRGPSMQVRMAEHYGMCFGVRDAVDLALGLTRQGPLTILGDLVHNPDVVARMDAAGAVRAGRREEVRTPAVLLTAHGTADRVKLELREQGLQVHDATCPLVTRVHLALRKLVAEGRHPVVIGQPKHVEVRGLVGDLDDYTIILDESDLDQLDERLAQSRTPGSASWPRRRSRWNE